VHGRPDQRRLAGTARGGLVNLAGAAVAGLAGFVVTWLVARALGPVRAGGFFAGTAAFVMAGTAAKLGTPTGLVYFLARLRAGGAGPAALRACLRTGLVPVAVAAVVAGAALWRYAPGLARLTARGTPGAGYAPALRVLAVLLPAAVLSDTLLAATRGFRAMLPGVLVDRLARPVAQVAALGALYLAGVRAAPGYALGWAAPYLASAVLAGAALARLVRAAGTATGTVDGTGAPAARTWQPPPTGFWRFTAPRALASSAQLALNRFDVLLLATMAGLRAAAVYAVAGRFLVLGQFANQAISQAVQPRLAERLAGGDTAGANELYQACTGWLVLAAWPLYLGVAGYTGTYLGLFGPGYRHATGPVLVLAAAAMVATGCGMVDMVLAMAGRTSWNLVNVLLALAVNIAVDVLAIPRWGVLGAALGLAAALVVNNVVPVVQVAAVLGLHPFGRGTLVAAALALACFGVPAVAGGPLNARGPAVAALAAALGLAGYAAGAYRLRRVLRLDVLAGRWTGPGGGSRDG